VPRISDYEEFLNASMVRDGDVLVLLDPGRFVEPEESGLDRLTFRIKVRLPDQRTKIWTMNKTTRRELAEAYGDDTENWVGKPVRVEIVQMKVRGQTKGVIYGHPVDEMPIQKAVPQAEGLPPNVSQETQMWLKFNETLIGKAVPAVVYNMMPPSVRDELVSLGWLYAKDDLPYLKADAKAALG
jgi:hypothetical protein